MDVFGGAPRFLAYPRPVVVQSGTDAVLKCQIGGDPRPAVIWERNNKKIDPQGRYRVFEEGNVYNLIIAAVTLEDSGQYICKAKNSIGETYAAATLKVEGEAQEMELREENKPRFLIKPLSTRVGRGDDAVFSCKLWGNPRPEVVWEKDGRKLNEIFESTHFCVGHQDGGWFQLKIFKTRAPDGGVYTCKARNEFGESLAGAVLLVDAGPGHEEEGNRNGYTNGHWKPHQAKQRSSRQVSSRLKDDPMTMSTKVKMFAVTEGKHAKFRCFVTGKPKPEIIWRKDGRLILSGRRYLLYEDREGYFTLKVLYCKQKDNGVYVCAASNTAGQTLSAVHLSVKEPLVRFKQPLIDLEVWERDLAVLECEVPEDSVPITWYLEDRRLQPGAKYGMEEWGTKRRLTIRDIGVDDDGIYLCEMPDGGRSIAEVAVKGTIVRKLPRKVDVLEGENAAFCVEVEKEEMDIHWYKDGTELRETHQTIIKSFGRTHILVFVNTMPQDSGLVIFLVGRSKTSSQLRVKAAKHCPPSCPVGVQINTEHANAALLSWVPAQDSRRNPPSGYVLERQEVGTGSQEWLQCLTTDSATSVEILGDSVPCEADYRFRICSVNKYGKSNNVEFPKTVHLVPVARIQAPLQDALVPEGQDALFSIELSSSVIGTWFLNGTQLQEDERYSMRRSRTNQCLRIRGVRDTDNGAEITFIAYGIRDSAALYIQAPLVKFSPLSEMDRNKFVEIGNPIVLYCELSDPAAPVHWYKNGVELQTMDGLHIQSEGTMRRIVIQSAEFSHSGVYCCDAIDDVIRFNVEVEAPPVRFSAIPDAERNKTIQTGCPIILQCELSDPSAQVYWYKDGSKLHPHTGLDILSEASGRKLIVCSAEFFHAGLYCCKTKGDTITFSVDVKAPPVTFTAIPEEMRSRSVEAGCPIVLQCEVSDPEAHVRWCKDDMQLISNAEIEIQSDGNTRTLVVESAELSHSGVYRCTTEDDSVEFQVEIKAIQAARSTILDAERTRSLDVGKPLQLECEVTDSSASVCWYKDGVKIVPDNGWNIQSNDTLRRLVIPSAELFHSGLYSCETSDGTMHFTVDIKAPTLPSSPSPEVVETQLFDTTCTTEPPCEISDPAVQASRQMNEEHDCKRTSDFQMACIEKALVIEPTHPSNSGAYYCATADDVAQLIVKNQVPSTTCLLGPEVEKTKSAEEHCPIVQQFEISDPIAKACWYKDGTQIYPKKQPASELQSSSEALPLQSDGLSGNGRFGCETVADAQLNVDVKAEKCHSGDEVGEIADASAHYTVDVKATPPWLSSDQETNRTTEEAYPVVCMPPKKSSNIFSDKRDDAHTCVEHSRHLPTHRSSYEHVTEQITTVHPEEFSDKQTIMVQSAPCHTSVKPTITQPEEDHHSQDSVESLNEELICTTRHAEGPSVQLHDSRQTAAQSVEFCDVLKTTTAGSEESTKSFKTLMVQSEEMPSSIQTITFMSKQSNPAQMSFAQSEELTEELTNHFQTSTELSNCLQTTTVPSDEFGNANQMSTAHLEKLSPCLQSKIAHTDDSCNSLRTPTAQFEKLNNPIAMPTVQSESSFYPLDTASLQPKECYNHQPGATVQSQRFFSPIDTACLQPKEFYNLQPAATVQPGEQYELPQSANVRSDKISHTGQTVPNQSEVLYQPMPVTTVQADCYNTKEAKDDQQGSKVTSGQRPSAPSSESYHSKQASAVQSEDIYYSRTCDSHWGDSVIANKVAVEAPPVRITTPREAEKSESVQVGEPIALRCELSDPNAQVTWYKDGIKLCEATGQSMVSEGSIRTLAIQSAMLSHAGIYSCKTTDDAMQFHVDVQAPLAKFSSISEADQKKTVTAGSPIALQCELSIPTGQVSWYKDGTKIQPENGVDLHSEGSLRSLVVQSAEPAHTGIYRCESQDDDIQFAVDVKARPVKFSELPEADRNKSIEEGSPILLSCDLTHDPSANVHWYKDGIELLPQINVEIRSNGLTRTLVIHSAERTHSGTYECSTADDTVTFKVDVKGRPPKLLPIPMSERYKMVAVGSPIILQCEVSDSIGQVSWSKDEVEIFCKTGLDMKRDGNFRKLMIHSAKVSDAGLYSCSLADDVVTFTVEVQAIPVRFSALPDVARNKYVEAGCPIKLQCEVSESTAQVYWRKDGVQLLPHNEYDIQTKEKLRTLAIQSAEVRHSGMYSCETPDDQIEFKVDVAAVPDTERIESVEAANPIKPQCEISDPTSQTCWYKDGVKLIPPCGLDVHSEGNKKTLVIQSATSSSSGVYSCKTDDGSDVKDFYVEEKAVPDTERIESVEAANPIKLQCEISDPTSQTCWYKDGVKLIPQCGVDFHSEGNKKTLVIQSATSSSSGVYSCKTDDGSDVKDFYVEEKAVPDTERIESVEAGNPIKPQCEISDPTSQTCWYKDGVKLISPCGLDVHSEGNKKTLVIQSATSSSSGVYSCKTDDGSDVKDFYVEEKAVPDTERIESVEAGNPIKPQCEISDPTTQTCWYKDGVKQIPQCGLDVHSEGNKKTLVIQSATSSSSGVYSCKTDDGSDVKDFYVEEKAVPDTERIESVEAANPIKPQCEISDPTSQTCWYKDGVKLIPQCGLDVHSEGNKKTLVIQSATSSSSGVYSCKTDDGSDFKDFYVEEKAVPDTERIESVEAGNPIKPQCEISDPTSQTCWYKDGVKQIPQCGLDVHSEGNKKTLVIQSATSSSSGVYSCKTDDGSDVKDFIVEEKAVPDTERIESVEAGNPIKPQCEISDLTSQTCWYKDGVKLIPPCGLDVHSEGNKKTLVIQSATSSSSGVYSCKTDDGSDVKDFIVEEKAPPVTFTDIPEENLFKSVVEHEPFALSCKVSRPDAVVQWYKDGSEVQPSDNVAMQADGTKRDLTIHSAQLSDTGTYTCRAGDNSLMFKLNVREPPVMIIHPKEDVHLDRHVREEIILSCELSRPNGVVNWYKDGQKLQESENIKLKIEGPYRRLKILTSGVEDSGEYVCDTADDSIFFHLNITEPPVRIVSPSQSQMELCQQTSERMVLSCEISRPNALVRWYRDGLEVEENDNLILEVDGVYRRLIIPETTVDDSAEYVCDTADDSVTFFVNIAEPPVRFVRPRKTASKVERAVGEALVLDCEVSRPNAEVTWKKNGEEVEDSRNVTILEDGVMRQLTIHSVTGEDAGQYVCDAKDDVMDFHVKVKELPVKILGKTEAKTEKQFLVLDDIILVCELSRSNVSVSWYKDNQLIDDSERYCIEEQGVFRSLVVLNAGLEDSGEYVCDAVDDKMVFYITVKEPPIKIIGNSGHPEHHILVEGEDLILECEVSRPSATVQWLWNGNVLKPDTRVKIDSHDVVRKLVLSGLQPSDSGKYICDAIDDKLITIVDVQEVPAKFVNKKTNKNIFAYENESVTLSAIVNQERANVRWLKDGQLLNEDNIHISSEGNTQKLTINPLQLSDSGEYVCDVNTDQMYFSLFVKEMKVKFIRLLENVVSLKGSSLTLRCEINKPKGDVQWLRNGREIAPSRRHTIRAQGRERTFTIHQTVDEDAGEYSCESTDDRTSAAVTVQTPRIVEFIAELRNITVCEGEDAIFKCVVSPEDTQLVWRLNDKQVAGNERTVTSSNGLCHMLCIHNCVVSDSGRVTADAEGVVSEADLQIQEQQVVFTKKMKPVVAEEYSDATLEVEVSLDSGEVQWMRQGVLIHPGAKYTPKHKGRKRTLTIHKLAMVDRGTYSCESLHDRTQAQLTVESRKVTIKRGLQDIRTMERETASFEVELSHANVAGIWKRNGAQLKPTNHFRISSKERVHSLTISNLSVEDTGSFMFCVENLKTSARLVVEEPPVTFLRKLEDQKFPEGAIVSIECELSRHNVDVRWMKNGAELKPGKDLRIYAMGRKRFLQIMKCHVSDSATYSCDAGDATTSCTVDVYERELLVLQDLEDLDIQEDENAVFVCEISVEDVDGEWYKNGERIQPTSTIKIRHEGPKHFLLMCNVRAEDSGEIKFVARHVESVAYLEVEELPVKIVKPLQDTTALEKSRVILDCTVSNPRCSIRWYKGINVILPSERFEICSLGCYRKLIIQQVALDDEGTYSVQVGDYTCAANLTVEAQCVLLVRELKDVEVVVPDEARFECEVSLPELKAPAWSLNGELLQPSSKVLVEKMGTVHRLTFRQTSPDMNGLVEFTLGKATSKAQLRVLSDP